MTKIHSRTVNPLSLMTDVFVELEHLKISLKKLRDELVEDPDYRHIELSDARRSCRRIDAELKVISQLLSYRKKESEEPETDAPPKGPPNFKLVS